jgi:hypothetical protein
MKRNPVQLTEIYEQRFKGNLKEGDYLGASLWLTALADEASGQKVERYLSALKTRITAAIQRLLQQQKLSDILSLQEICADYGEIPYTQEVADLATALFVEHLQLHGITNGCSQKTAIDQMLEEFHEKKDPRVTKLFLRFCIARNIAIPEKSLKLYPVDTNS